MRGHDPSTVDWCGGIHRLVEAQVEKRPEAVAVVSATESITYRELDARARALSFLIGDKGIGRNDRVALFANRSVDMIVGLLGVLQAGASYVPLDPGYPAERLSFMVSDCDASLLVVPPADREHLPELAGTEVVEVPGALAEAGLSDDDDGRRAGDPEPSDLAYVIYTSGSTGRPKGVLLEHGGLVNLMRFTLEQMELGPSDRVLQFASFSFDASIWEIFAALASGGTLVLGDRDSLLPGPSLHELMRRHEVTVALLSPSVLRALSHEGLDRLRIMVAGTEKLTSDLVKRWAPGRRFFNAYGPTETTIYSTILEVDGESLTEEAPSIGSPIPETEICILDESLEVLPDGEVGELAIAGVGVGRGYWRREALTAERFVTLGGRRVYRTGDQARVLADGNIEYLGRRDFQVKVRGFRVELPEIESTLEQHPSVGSAAVVDDRDTVGQTLLRAFVVPRGGDAVDPAVLRAFLSERLPDYMVPSSFSPRERWPLTPNGKLDRRALLAGRAEARAKTPGAAVSSGEHEGGGEGEGRGDPDTVVLALLREVLGVDDLEASGDLAASGLHSLAVAELVARIEAAFGVRVKYSEVFTDGNALALAARVEKALAERPETRRPAVVSTDADGKDIPLSFAQEGVWLVERMHPECLAYRFQSRFDLSGALDVEALTRSLNAIVERHEILRTTFPERDGRPVQVVHDYEPFELPVEEPPESFDRLAREPDGFDVARLPLITWRLFRLGPERHVLVHREHHLLHDGWSFGVFLEELASLYGAFHAGAGGQEPGPLAPLDPPSLQYREFATRQRARFGSDTGINPALDYWVNELKGLPPPPSLPSDFTRPAAKRFRGDQLRETVGAELYRTLREASAREGVTVHTWLHAAFQTFIHRFTGARALAVGTGFANRGEAGLDRMLGMVIHTAVVRGDFHGEPTFLEVLHRLRATILKAADHQDVPFDEVVRALNPERHSENESLLFNTFFDSYDKPFPETPWPDLHVDRVDGLSNGASKFDIVALVVPRTSRGHRIESATLIWDYDTDLFRPETAARMLTAYVEILRDSLARPGERVDRLGVVGSEERARLLLRARGPELRSGAGAAASESVTARFEASCARNPDAVALESASETLSYAELDGRASRLARALIMLGVVRGDVVGIHLPRGVDAVVSMLAVLKAGAAYLPLDPGWPAPRWTALVGSARPTALIANGPVAGYDGPITSPGTESGAAEPAGDVETVGEDLAYVMFTSGSTGEPKGVDVPHRGLVRLAAGPGVVPIGPDDRVLELAPLSFDASTFEIWGALLNGAALVLYPDDVPTADELASFVARNEVTAAWLTAPLFHLVAETSFHVEKLVAGGDTLSPSKARAYLGHLGGAGASRTLVNGYGPTENTTFSCCHAMTAESAGDIGRTVPIGRPIAGSTAFVLDEGMELVGHGVPGELYVGGEGLAWGYRSRAAETAAAFLPNPFATRPGMRLYRTGDFCRWLPDGSLEFLGRRDAQVKLRGFRVELGEVEAALGAMPGVSEVAATVEDDALLAFVTGPGATEAEAEAVRAWAAERLPSHMVPSTVAIVESLPMTPSGKIDRARLRAPARLERGPDEARVAPRTDRERAVAAVWSDLLRVAPDELGVHDNFFRVGGHSLLASRIATRLSVPLATLFRFPTVAELAAAIDASPRRTTREALDAPEMVAREEGEL